MTKLDHRTLVPRLRALQLELRQALRLHMQTQAVEQLSQTARDDEGETSRPCWTTRRCKAM